jgi:hypothetical protein
MLQALTIIAAISVATCAAAEEPGVAVKPLMQRQATLQRLASTRLLWSTVRSDDNAAPWIRGGAETKTASHRAWLGGENEELAFETSETLKNNPVPIQSTRLLIYRDNKSYLLKVLQRQDVPPDNPRSRMIDLTIIEPPREVVPQRGLAQSSLGKLLSLWPAGSETFDELVAGTTWQVAGDGAPNSFEGTGKFGKVRLVLDAKHGFHVSQLNIQRGAGDLFSGKPLPRETFHRLGGYREASFDFKVTAWKELNGLALPVESTATAMITFGNDSTSTSTVTVKTTELRALDEAESNKIFDLSRIPDGARIMFAPERPGRYVWRNRAPALEAVKGDIPQ